jgi:hypothetical protein
MTVTVHNQEYVVMNGYEGRSVSIAVLDRCMPKAKVHATHNVWVEIAPKGGILLECGSVACVRGAKRLVDLLVATKLPSDLRANGNDSVVLNQQNIAEWKVSGAGGCCLRMRAASGRAVPSNPRSNLLPSIPRSAWGWARRWMGCANPWMPWRPRGSRPSSSHPT